MVRSPNQIKALESIADGAFYPDLVEENDGWHARWRAIGIDNHWVDEYVREASISALTEDAEDQQHPTLHNAWMMALKSRTGLVRWDDAECREFAKILNQWTQPVRIENDARKALCFSLASGNDDEELEIRCNAPKGAMQYLALGQATQYCGVLRGLRKGEDKWLSVPISCAQAEEFLRRGAPALVDAGYAVEGVDIAAEVEAGVVIDAAKDEHTPVKMKLTVRVAGEEVNADEIKFLLDQGSSLVYFRDHWIEVDRNILKQALRALEKGIDAKTSPIIFALGLGHVGALELKEVKAGGWVRGLIDRLRKRGGTVDVGANRSKMLKLPLLKGELREYQVEGVKWMDFMTSNGFGALLADDMGLGKTIQTIAWITADVKARTPALIVTPLTLVANWRHELKRFAPELPDGAVTVVNYNRLVREYSRFSSKEWAALIIDEAQSIKNPDTRIARAVKALSPKNRIALTGTPIENTVEDIWSIEDFLNPGFLGDRKTFRDRFVKPIAMNHDSAAKKKLSHALEPFVMRRLKNDPRIVSELGSKREIREYCELTTSQRLDYEQALSDYRVTNHEQGDIFALLTKLKQVCDGAGKMARLLELVEKIFEAKESVLVFTQYAKVGAMIVGELEKQFGRKFPYLHGELSATARERQIEEFRTSKEPSAFVLSLKAGGFGLNLTQATHVIHFDRWWNPAVESQATDRAHRIGQLRDVFVHLMITEGTLEEHIDKILEDKSSLKELIADGQEFWKAVSLEAESDV